jgi:hypothetical protein
VVRRCHAEESLHVVDPDVFARVLPPDGEVFDNSIQQWRSGSSQAVRKGQTPSISHQMPPRVRSVTYVKITFLEARRTLLCCSFSNRVFSVDGTNVSDGLCSFGVLIELVKKKVPEMFIFLNLTLHSFGTENSVPLGQIGKFQKYLIEENESYKMMYYI